MLVLTPNLLYVTIINSNMTMPIHTSSLITINKDIIIIITLIHVLPNCKLISSTESPANRVRAPLCTGSRGLTRNLLHTVYHTIMHTTPA